MAVGGELVSHSDAITVSAAPPTSGEGCNVGAGGWMFAWEAHSGAVVPVDQVT